VPLRYLAGLFAAGDEESVAAVYRKLLAVRVYMRSQRAKDVSDAELRRCLSEGRTTAEEAEAIFRLTSLPTFEERFVIPPLAREEAIESALDPLTHKQQVGFGFNQAPTRRW
jgi:nitrate reductase beta subunit